MRKIFNFYWIKKRVAKLFFERDFKRALAGTIVKSWTAKCKCMGLSLESVHFM
jgi:hypothetical protein